MMGRGTGLRGAPSWGHLGRRSITSVSSKIEIGEKPRAVFTIIIIPSFIPMLEKSNGIVARNPGCYTVTVLGSNPTLPLGDFR